MIKKIKDLGVQLQKANDKRARDEKEMEELNMQVVEAQTKEELKKDEVRELKRQLKVYEHVDLEKYRNLTHENRQADAKIKKAEKEMNEEKKKSESRLYAAKEKDDHLIRMKLMFQRAIYNLSLDMQEVLDHTQKAKEGLGKEVEGFDEENYQGMQKNRMHYADRALQEIRRLRIGQPYDRYQQYENPGDTEVTIDAMRKQQDEL